MVLEPTIHSHLDTSSPFTSVLHDDFIIQHGDFTRPGWWLRCLTQISDHCGIFGKNRNSLQLVLESKYIHPPRHSGVYKNESFWYLFLNQLFVFNIPNKEITNSSCFISTRNCLVAQKKTVEFSRFCTAESSSNCPSLWFFSHGFLPHKSNSPITTPEKLTWNPNSLVGFVDVSCFSGKGVFSDSLLTFFEGGGYWNYEEFPDFPTMAIESLRRRLTARLHSEDCLAASCWHWCFAHGFFRFQSSVPSLKLT